MTGIGFLLMQVTEFVPTGTGLAATMRLYLRRPAGAEVFLLTSPFIEPLRGAVQSSDVYQGWLAVLADPWLFSCHASGVTPLYQGG
jgi:hypothetical protein